MQRLLRLGLLAWTLAGCSSVPGGPGSVRGGVLDASARQEIVHTVGDRLRAAYVSPSAAELARRRLSARLESGAYDTSDRRDFANRLTMDLQHVTHDGHLRVSDVAEPPPQLDDRHPTVFGRVDRVGDVAYIQVVSFGVPPERARDEIARTMSSVADVRALVLDLSENGGGHPGTVALLASYLFGEAPVHLLLGQKAHETRRALPHHARPGSARGHDGERDGVQGLAGRPAPARS